MVAAKQVESPKTGQLFELRAYGLKQMPRIGFLLGQRPVPPPRTYDHAPPQPKIVVSAQWTAHQLQRGNHI
jgi:hypothetical protein